MGDEGTYTGAIDEQGQRTGQGSCTWCDGSTYIGQWKDGKRHGKGVYSLSDGTSYDGEWFAD
eukprot:CAMPEP_0116881286 /NCGR_PEP_ID=MMETSP0463-20121206/13411_1 /TAXON_ID=181622 /ORGANISM="Strombidinopsis sp, Strain SopsisLIS2011" /LENGTH=61 /DNA_ID=CAMNT_0004533105 /DNA_START=416 /DNA_END=601 /DNA_ORIENTATION=-